MFLIVSCICLVTLYSTKYVDSYPKQWDKITVLPVPSYLCFKSHKYGRTLRYRIFWRLVDSSTVTKKIYIYKKSSVTRYVSRVTAHVLPVNWHLSPVTCHLPWFAYFLSYVCLRLHLCWSLYRLSGGKRLEVNSTDPQTDSWI